MAIGPQTALTSPLVALSSPATPLTQSLCTLPPVCSLDVDDLDDISNLEQWVANSLVLVVFLSGSVDALGEERSDYFSSKNCLRELRHAIEQGLEIVFVYEPLGTCSMAAHQAACPDDLRPVLLRSRIVPWYRLKEFQQVSLLQILRRIYAAAPSNKRLYDDFHHVHDVVRQPLKVRPLARGERPFHVYISPHNEGVEHLLHRMQLLIRKSSRGQALRATHDPSDMASGRCDHFLLLMSGSLLDALESKDSAKSAPAAALLDELRVALRRDAHVLLVHDCRAALYASGVPVDQDEESEEMATGRPWRARTMAVLPTAGRAGADGGEESDEEDEESGSANGPGGSDGDGGSASGSRSRGVTRGMRRLSVGVSGRWTSRAGVQDSRKRRSSVQHLDEPVWPTGRYASFRSIYSRTPVDLVQAGLYQELALPLYGVGLTAHDEHLDTSIALVLRAVLAPRAARYNDPAFAKSAMRKAVEWLSPGALAHTTALGSARQRLEVDPVESETQEGKSRGSSPAGEGDPSIGDEQVDGPGGDDLNRERSGRIRASSDAPPSLSTSSLRVPSGRASLGSSRKVRRAPSVRLLPVDACSDSYT